MMRYKLIVDVEVGAEIDHASVSNIIVDTLYQLPRGFWFTVEEITSEEFLEE